VLVEKAEGSPRPGLWTAREQAVDRIREAVSAQGGTLDHLVLLGDVFDLSLVPLDEAWEATRVFLQAVIERGFATRIIYMPGNHDFSMWQYFEQDLRITRRTQKVPPQAPLPLRFSVPGILDGAGLSVPDAVQPLGGGYFQGLWPVQGGEFAVVFPNLYMLDGDRATLLTHGQYFDGFWRFLGDLSLNCASPHLPGPVAKQPTISDLVQLNHPTSVLTASALGQSDLFGDLARSVKDAWERDGDGPVLAIRDRMRAYFQDRYSRGGLLARVLAPTLCAWVGRLAGWLVVRAGRSKPPRWNSEYAQENAETIGEYMELSRRELSTLLGREVDGFERLVFGHTHLPSGPGEEPCKLAGAGLPGTPCVNTGGWIRDGRGNWSGGVVVYDNSRPDGSRWTMAVVGDSGVGEPFKV